MEFKQTRHQVARGTRPDGETEGKLYLIKKVSEMRATYQVRLLAYRASLEDKKLVIEVPRGCRIHRTLRELSKDLRQAIEIRRA